MKERRRACTSREVDGKRRPSNSLIERKTLKGVTSKKPTGRKINAVGTMNPTAVERHWGKFWVLGGEKNQEPLSRPGEKGG